MAKVSNVLWVAVIMLAVLVVAVVAFTMQQSSISTDAQNAPVQSSLLGKSATLAVQARDLAADDVSTRRQVPVYIQDPDGVWIETGSSTSAASGAATQFTSGIKVSDKAYKVLAFNNTYGSVTGAQDVMLVSQSPSVDVDVYTIATNLKMTLYSSDDIALTEATSNLTLGAGETQSWTKLRIKNNITNTAFNLYGLYIDLDPNTNISSISINDAKVDAAGTMSLNSITTDDKTWKLKTPIMIYEFAQVDIGTIAVTADGDGTGDNRGEAFSLYAVDGVYFYSALGNGVLLGPENDAVTSADVGATNRFVSGWFN
mgnify:CR=1 FL=1